jgi:hypothetical protein
MLCTDAIADSKDTFAGMPCPGRGNETTWKAIYPTMGLAIGPSLEIQTFETFLLLFWPTMLVN